jgi:hypothetical protein
MKILRAMDSCFCRIIFLLATALGLFPITQASASEPLYDKSWAVVIGIDKYQQWPHLEAAVNDARAMADRLKEMGFDQITFLANEEATRNRILTEIGNNLSRSAGPNDRVVIYFAGHGFTEELPAGDQVGYLIPVDSPQSNFFTHAISMRQIRETFSRLRAKHIYYVIDSCFSGYGFTRGGGVPAGSRGYLQVVTERRAVQMVTAGRKGDLAHEQGGHGIFTAYLIRGLQGEADLNGDGLVTASELGSFVQPNVYQASLQKQLPQYGRLDGEGEVVFVVGEDPRNKQSRERLEALGKELSRLNEQRQSLDGKKELLLTDIMRLDVEIRQNKERVQALEKEMASLKVSMEGKRPPAPPSPSGATTPAPGPSPSPAVTPPSSSASPTAPLGGEPRSASRFLDNGNGTVTDSITGFMWEKGGSDQPVKYGDGLAYVHRLNEAKLGGYSDWRVPKIQELRSLIVDASLDGLMVDPVFDRKVTSCWSSTEYFVSNRTHYAGIDFRDGTTLTRSEHADSYHIRAVRGPVESLKAK